MVEITQFGLKKTGTNLTRYMLQEFTNLTVDPHKDGWKHGPVRSGGWTPFILSVRHPVDWVLSYEDTGSGEDYYVRDDMTWLPMMNWWLHANKGWLRHDACAHRVQLENWILQPKWNLETTIDMLNQSTDIEAEIIKEPELPDRKIAARSAEHDETIFRNEEVNHDDFKKDGWKDKVSSTFIESLRQRLNHQNKELESMIEEFNYVI